MCVSYITSRTVVMWPVVLFILWALHHCLCPGWYQISISKSSLLPLSPLPQNEHHHYDMICYIAYCSSIHICTRCCAHVVHQKSWCCSWCWFYDVLACSTHLTCIVLILLLRCSITMQFDTGWCLVFYCIKLLWMLLCSAAAIWHGVIIRTQSKNKVHM